MTTMKMESEYPEEPRYVDISQSDEADEDPWQEEEARGSKDEAEIEEAGDEPAEDTGDSGDTEDEPSVVRTQRFARTAPPQQRFAHRPAAAAPKGSGFNRPGPVRRPGSFNTRFPHNPSEKPFPLERSASPSRPEPSQKMLPASIAAPIQAEEALEASGSAGDTGRTGSSAQSAKTLLPEWYILEDIIQKHQPLPEGSIILGIDKQGKPLVVSLDDVNFGAFLFMGDSSAANRKHLQSVVASAEMLNQPEILQIDVITPKPDGYASKRSNLRRICDVEEDCIYSLLGDYLVLVEQRLRDDRQLPYQLLILDQIETLADRLAEESLRFLRWIIRRGPQVGIWPLASIDSENLAAFDLKTFKSFGFQLFGKMTRAATVTRFTRMSPQMLQTLSPGNQGCFMIEEDIVPYSIPEVAK